jgi:hypothetical protein
MPEQTAWSNDEILREVFVQTLRQAYEIASSPNTKDGLKEALDDDDPARLRDRLVSLQIGSLLSLLRFLDGAVGPSNWPGLSLVNTDTGESLSNDFQWSFAEAESIVMDEVERPSAVEE